MIHHIGGEVSTLREHLVLERIKEEQYFARYFKD
jgi:hypothetical protein